MRSRAVPELAVDGGSCPVRRISPGISATPRGNFAQELTHSGVDPVVARLHSDRCLVPLADQGAQRNRLIAKRLGFDHVPRTACRYVLLSMRAALASSLSCLLAFATACASSGIIRGTVSAVAPSESTVPTPEPSGRIRAPSSVLDAVVYVERIPLRVESKLAAPPTAHFEMRSQAFWPRVLVVPVGTSVEFSNRDNLFHHVFSVSPTKPFDLGRYGQGKSNRVTFNKPGLINVYCNLHPSMAAYVLVAPNRAFARPDSSGRFVLPTLPPGQYVVNVWHPDFPAVSRVVTVVGGREADLNVTLGS